MIFAIEEQQVIAYLDEDEGGKRITSRFSVDQPDTSRVRLALTVEDGRVFTFVFARNGGLVESSVDRLEADDGAAVAKRNDADEKAIQAARAKLDSDELPPHEQADVQRFVDLNAHVGQEPPNAEN